MGGCSNCCSGEQGEVDCYTVKRPKERLESNPNTKLIDDRMEGREEF